MNGPKIKSPGDKVLNLEDVLTVQELERDILEVISEDTVLKQKENQTFKRSLANFFRRNIRMIYDSIDDSVALGLAIESFAERAQNLLKDVHTNQLEVLTGHYLNAWFEDLYDVQKSVVIKEIKIHHVPQIVTNFVDRTTAFEDLDILVTDAFRTLFEKKVPKKEILIKYEKMLEAISNFRKAFFEEDGSPKKSLDISLEMAMFRIEVMAILYKDYAKDENSTHVPRDGIIKEKADELFESLLDFFSILTNNYGEDSSTKH